MRKTMMAALPLVMTLGLAGCGNQAPEPEVDEAP